MRVIGVIQARVGSTRLPGKVLLPLGPDPMLAHVVARLSRARNVDGVVVATTILPEDDPIERLCRARSWDCFRGHPTDLLDRYHRAAREAKADAIVRVTSDCPMLDASVVERVVERLVSAAPRLDYVSNVIPRRTFPRGLDCEAFTVEALARADSLDTNMAWREHCTPFLYRRSDLFRTDLVTSDTDLSHLRWTVDTDEDYAFAQAVFEHFDGQEFGVEQILELLARRPELATLNRHVEQKAV